jgi:hypothetical protein
MSQILNKTLIQAFLPITVFITLYSLVIQEGNNVLSLTNVTKYSRFHFEQKVITTAYHTQVVKEVLKLQTA